MKIAIKVIFVAMFFVGIVACNNDDNFKNQQYVALPIDSVNLPDSANLGSNIVVRTHFTIRPDCEYFYGYGYDQNDTIRTVATWVLQGNLDNCDISQQTTISPTFNFQPQQSGTYLFKFYNGPSEIEGEDSYILDTIVINP